MDFGRFVFNLGDDAKVVTVGFGRFNFKVDNMKLYVTQKSLGNRLSRAEIEEVVSYNNIDTSGDVGFFIKDGHSKKFFVWYFALDDTYGYEKLSVV